MYPDVTWMFSSFGLVCRPSLRPYLNAFFVMVLRCSLGPPVSSEKLQESGGTPGRCKSLPLLYGDRRDQKDFRTAIMKNKTRFASGFAHAEVLLGPPVTRTKFYDFWDTPAVPPVFSSGTVYSALLLFWFFGSCALCALLGKGVARHDPSSCHCVGVCRAHTQHRDLVLTQRACQPARPTSSC